MDPSTQKSESIGPSRNVLGYKLKERIGSGGFGEVWSAEAPGGLMKAVKVVYGYHDEKRAQAELKSLDRVKQLRHPFLLSLERIEVFEGQLIVVSELADKSMADLFNEFAIKGEPGIPRDELVKYIRDAADALDYLSEEHSLQHLDVKPENLLIVGSHVKVADFGLVKELHGASMSLMSGMTPAYAAPELFDGKPGSHSDQYSLAIVYQEMLTSLRPFLGTTPAQLAAQHMHGKPNLRPLPKDDRATIARSLSKDPNVRFTSCGAMAEELCNRKRTTSKSVRPIQPTARHTSDTIDSVGPRQSMNSEFPDATLLVESEGLPFQASEIQTLDPPDCDPSDATVRPTLIVGVGATGNRVVHRIKQQLVARHGSLDSIPALKLLAIDSDATELSRIGDTNDPGALTTREAIHTPLHKPSAYREQASSSLAWLSRRWIYNIPRSQQTEGLRPLGRLLFANHFQLLYDSLRESITEIAKPEHIATTAETLEMNPGDPQPRVFVISSISGGIGSGMVLDLAYTIKLLMAECGLQTDSVTGMMLHSSYQRNRDPGLAAANAFAFLTELRHFVETGYPGDKTLGIPDFEGEMPFDHSYFYPLGDDLSQSDFEAQIGSLAEYVQLSALTKCSVFLDSCRELDADREHFSLRTSGLSVSGPGNTETGKQAINRLGLGLVGQWIHGDPETEANAKPFVSDTLNEQRLTEAKCVDDVTEQAHEFFEGSFDSIAGGATELVMRGERDVCGDLAAYLDGIFGCPLDRQDDEYQEPEICLQMSERLDNRAMVVGDAVCTALMSLLESPQFELCHAGLATQVSREQLGKCVQQTEAKTAERWQASANLLTGLKELVPAKGRIDAVNRDKVAETVAQYSAVRLQEFASRFAGRYLRTVQSTLAYATERITQFRSQLEMISNEFTSDELPLGLRDEAFSMDRLMASAIEDDLPKHITQAEIQVYESLIRERGGYLEAMSNQSCWYHRLPAAIRTAAQQVLADAYKKLSLERVIAANNIQPEQLVKWLTEKINQARPAVNDCGGASRIMLALPALSSDDSDLPAMLQRQFTVPSKAINGTRGNVVICFEAEDVSLASVAYRLLELRPDAMELVKRIHTRNDVQWTTLNDLL